MNVLSLFDGMSCGMIAFIKAGINIKEYFAYEIDKYAIKTSNYNFPKIKHQGDVFDADFTQYKNIDFLIGGSPCTYWSIARNKKDREIQASGLGWELFSQYVRALNETKPKYFIYENNFSMSKNIKDKISETFGFQPIMINSSLVSAQNRKRLYWVGKINKNKNYDKVNVCQPDDKKIIIQDILENKISDKKLRYNRTICLNSKSGRQNIKDLQPSLQNRIYSILGKSTAITTSFLPSIVYQNDNGPYLVRNGIVNIKNKSFPINLEDGRYTIRKFSILELKRLQTIPDNYFFPVCNTQSQKMLGNGWTIDVIVHLINSCLNEKQSFLLI